MSMTLKPRSILTCNALQSLLHDPKRSWCEGGRGCFDAVPLPAIRRWSYIIGVSIVDKLLFLLTRSIYTTSISCLCMMLCHLM